MPHEVPLSSLVAIIPGSTEPGLAESGYPLLSPSELDESGQLALSPRRYVPQTPAAERARLQVNDILLPSKGNRWTATLVGTELVSMVASTGFFILRVETQAVLPAFLRAYLNHPVGQQQIRAQVNASTTVAVLNQASVRALKIPVLPLATQHHLVTLYAGWTQQQRLVAALRDQYELGYHHAFALGVAQASS